MDIGCGFSIAMSDLSDKKLALTGSDNMATILLFNDVVRDGCSCDVFMYLDVWYSNNRKSFIIHHSDIILYQVGQSVMSRLLLLAALGRRDLLAALFYDSPPWNS